MVFLCDVLQDILAKVLQDYIPLTVSKKHATQFNTSVRQDCEDVHALSTQVVQQRIQQVAQELLSNAVREGLETYDQYISLLDDDCPDIEACEDACKVGSPSSTAWWHHALQHYC